MPVVEPTLVPPVPDPPDEVFLVCSGVDGDDEGPARPDRPAPPDPLAWASPAGLELPARPARPAPPDSCR